jgi:dinuclear metal center YbgI/SA1388 family protein
MAEVSSVIRAMEHIAPPRLATPDDRPRIGLHAGHPGKRVDKVGLSLDATLGALKEAEQWGADMLVVHHPRFYRPIASLTPDDPSGQRAISILAGGMAVYSAHTNLDVAPGGTNDLLAEAAGLTDARVIIPVLEERLLKLAVFVPTTHVEAVRQALDDAGAGAIGNYTGCTFRSPGVGTFRCGPNAKPFQGRPGSFEEAEEFRLETVFGESLRETVVAAMLAAHPYEEVAYDIYGLKNRGTVYGLGRVGNLGGGQTIGTLAAKLAKATGSTMTQYSGQPNRRASRAAVWAGEGAPVEELICASVCDVLIAGELRYHDVETLRDYGIEAITLGHGFSEELVLRPLAARLRALLPGVGFKVMGRGRIAMRNA